MPRVIEKRQVGTDEIEQKIKAMYTKGMSQRDIEDNLREIYGAEVHQTLISRITDKILPEVNEWQNRPLETVYPIIYFDGIVLFLNHTHWETGRSPGACIVLTESFSIRTEIPQIDLFGRVS